MIYTVQNVETLPRCSTVNKELLRLLRRANADSFLPTNVKRSRPRRSLIRIWRLHHRVSSCLWWSSTPCQRFRWAELSQSTVRRPSGAFGITTSMVDCQEVFHVWFDHIGSAAKSILSARKRTHLKANPRCNLSTVSAQTKIEKDQEEIFRWDRDFDIKASTTY